MHEIWSWLAVAGIGALHGLNPISGWIFAVLGAHRNGLATPLPATLGAIAIGHIASLGLVAFVFVQGVPFGDTTALGIAVLLPAALVAHCLAGKKRVSPMRVLSSRAGLALWSFITSTAHGTGMMLVPAFMPLCLSGSPASKIAASGSLLLAMLAAVVHLLAMLAVAAIMTMRGRIALMQCMQRYRQYQQRRIRTDTAVMRKSAPR